MIVEIERRPRIAVDIYVKVEGEWFDLDELRVVFLTLEIGDVAVDDAFPRELSDALSNIGVVTIYNRGDGDIVSSGPKYVEFRQQVTQACVREQLPLI